MYYLAVVLAGSYKDPLRFVFKIFSKQLNPTETVKKVQNEPYANK